MDYGVNDSFVRVFLCIEWRLITVSGVLIGAIVGVAGKFVNWEFAAFMMYP